MESGHIPGSKTVPWKSLMTSDQTGYQELRPVNELQDIFKEKGVDLAKPIIASCGSGRSIMRMFTNAYKPMVQAYI